jgi:hypothetical protein
MQLYCFTRPYTMRRVETETIAPYGHGLYRGLWPQSKTTRYAGGRLLMHLPARQAFQSIQHFRPQPP